MKGFILVVFLTVISFPAFAHVPEGRSKKIDFSEMKEARLKSLDEMRACISQSNNFDELFACRKKKWKK